MDFKQMYQEKLVSAEKAASVIKSGDWVDYGWTTATPIAVDKEIAKRLPELTDVNFRGGILMWVPEIFKIENPAEHMTWNSWHMGGIERKAIAQGFSYYAPIRYSELPRYYRESQNKPDVAVFQVSPMDEHGFFNFGPNASHMAAVCETSKVVIVEVNENMPVCFGGTEEGVHISHVDMIVEGDNPAIAEMGGAAAASDVDEAVAKLILEEIPDGAVLSLGVGGVPFTVANMLAQSDKTDLGCHTGTISDAFLALYKAGKLTNKKKEIDNGYSTWNLAMGSQELYDWLDNEPQLFHPADVDYVHSPYRIGEMKNVISINGGVELDLMGQENAESAGTRQLSGIGGQMDFLEGAFRSEGGKGFICLASTHKKKDGSLKSNIVPFIPGGSTVSAPRTMIQYVATEYGIAKLTGLTLKERADAMIAIAHPDFRDELRRYAEENFK